MRTGKRLFDSAQDRQQALRLGSGQAVVNSKKLKIFGLIVTCALMLGVQNSVEAQQSGKIPRIGYLSYTGAPQRDDEEFFQALRNLGWIEGQTVHIEYRWAAGQLERLPPLAKELVDLKVDLIVTRIGTAVRAARAATKTIPIVMLRAADAVENGYVASLARPGGNITGMSEDHPGIHTKLLDLVHETLPQATRVAVLYNPKSTTYLNSFKAIAAVGPKIGLTIQSIQFDHSKKDNLRKEKVEAVLSDAARNRAEALIVMPTMYSILGKFVADFAAKNRTPVFSTTNNAVAKHFGLVAYSWNTSDMSERAAAYVDKILKGAKPADLPVERPRKFALLVNLKTAKQLNLTIPPSVLAKANEVIR